MRMGRKGVMSRKDLFLLIDTVRTYLREYVRESTIFSVCRNKTTIGGMGWLGLIFWKFKCIKTVAFALEAAGIFNSMVPYVRKPSFVVSLHGEQKSVENVN